VFGSTNKPTVNALSTVGSHHFAEQLVESDGESFLLFGDVTVNALRAFIVNK
jgi:hypothetical protein